MSARDGTKLEASGSATQPCSLSRFHVHGSLERNNQYKHGISRRYLLLDDDGRAYQEFARNEFREIPIDDALALVEAPLKLMGKTLETPYDSAYVHRKYVALREAGIEVLRIRMASEDVTG